MHFFKDVREIWHGKNVYRLLMNIESSHYTIHGKTIDIGSGTKLASYHRYLKKDVVVTVECLNFGVASEVNGGGKAVNLETDALPYADASCDTVLMFNVLEHVYNYEWVLSEVSRILKPGGTILGAVPFLVAYHPDPHDYWRYTSETLFTIFTKIGFKEVIVRPFGKGPFTAAWSQLEPIMPRIFKLIAIPIARSFDSVLVKFRPRINAAKFPLGHFFIAVKN